MAKKDSFDELEPIEEEVEEDETVEEDLVSEEELPALVHTVEMSSGGVTYVRGPGGKLTPSYD